MLDNFPIIFLFDPIDSIGTGGNISDNTPQDWLIAVAVFIGSIIISRAFYWFFKNVIRKYTSQRKNKLLDITIDTLEEPLAFGLIIIGVWYITIVDLSLPQSTDNFFRNLIFFLCVFDIAWAFNRFFSAIVTEYVEPAVKKSEGHLDDQILPLIRKATTISVWTIAVIVGLNNAGYNVSALLAGLGVGGLAFALAAQDTISNLLGGFTILADRPFVVGDRIQGDSYDGFVTEIGLRSTRIRTFEGQRVTVPNSLIADGACVNVSTKEGHRIAVTLGLTYSMSHTQMSLALDLLKKLVQDKQHILNKEHEISFNSFGDFSLNIVFVYSIRRGADIFNAQTEMNLSILERFNMNGLDFAFPSQTIYHKPV
ncbi:MAG: mechanosensitive ion channel family protein [Saprospiraceae bacterium]|nr:mechanosensitive ion channel family protein [Saprospiraceae bacterium]